MSEFNLGIVGHAANKFTPETELKARDAIRQTIGRLGATTVVSGGCHLGGADIWAEEVADELGIPKLIHEPRVRQWGAPGGYRDRNLAIARDSDLVLVVVVAEYPPGYSLPRFGGGHCYHCRERNPKHVKSGGCWTAWNAKNRLWEIITL